MNLSRNFTIYNLRGNFNTQNAGLFAGLFLQSLYLQWSVLNGRENCLKRPTHCKSDLGKVGLPTLPTNE